MCIEDLRVKSRAVCGSAWNSWKGDMQSANRGQKLKAEPQGALTFKNVGGREKSSKETIK